MDLRKLECFVAVARMLHFGRAADFIGVRQSVVSEAVKALEEALGGKLLERTSRRVSLTPLGEAFLKDIQPSVMALKTALSDARRRAQGRGMELAIGYLGGGFYELTSGIVAEFQRRRPDVRLRFVELNYLNQGSAVVHGMVDVAIVRLPLPNAGLSRGATLFRDARLLVVPEGHRLQGRALVDPEELRHECMVQLPPGYVSDGWTSYHFPTATPEGRRIAAGPEITTVREGLVAVATGDCVMTLSARAQNYFTHPGIAFVELDLPPIESALVWRIDDQRPVIQDLENAARAVAQRMGTMLA
ncbi:DNA-binding transcriptional LysR family regulator [Microvirga flocculans]|uniref:DNA-binding transcriptional LysR family regulator n=1 Tax=Microvirga flocculans TaxID=217168 RepID=A0A7W6N6V3_9HYPH|nr:LysR family transcriptional regulator [Microvirga flocculans]MBB4038820.1 DNA-binding transcriptional LysR family regulator [Microvirga flocculans]